MNKSGSIVWQCFDGSGTIAAIAADVAEVFGADPAAVSADVLTLARDVGSIGFLVGVHEEVLDVGDEPTGIAIGVPFPDFDATEEDGTRCSAEQLRGRRALLVSWSSTCSYCERITDDLAELAPSLARVGVGVDIVLLATGGAQANRASLDRSKTPFACRLWLRHDDTAAGFEGMGTPVAYLIDEEGAVAEPVAFGSTEVVQLARRIVGQPDLRP